MRAMDTPNMLPLPEDTQKALSALPLPDSLPSFEEFQKDPAVLSPYADMENGMMILRLFSEWIPLLKKQYDAAGIPGIVFWDSLKDLSIWAGDYWVKHHSPGFCEWEWVGNTFRMKVFRLGRLQFEPRVLISPIVSGGRTYPAGTPVLEVHIPAGEPLEDSAVAKSLESALVFFETCFHSRFSLFHCHSWLLSPQLQGLLPPQSRILKFQNRFSVYAQDRERQAEERVFGFLSDDPGTYPENTTLRQTLKKALSDGVSVGMGMGTIPIP